MFNLNRENWAPVNLLKTEDYTGQTGIAYDAVGLSVSYRINGGTPITKTLGVGDWKEGTNGAYSIRFLASECNTLGMIAFEVAYTNCVVYYGADQVEAEQPILISLGRM